MVSILVELTETLQKREEAKREAGFPFDPNPISRAFTNGFYESKLNRLFCASLTRFFKIHLALETTTLSPERKAALERQKTAQFKEFARVYGRVVLYCSNFERTKDDEKFFENLYLFARLVLNRVVGPSNRKEVEAAMEVGEKRLTTAHPSIIPSQDVTHNEAFALRLLSGDPLLF